MSELFPNSSHQSIHPFGTIYSDPEDPILLQAAEIIAAQQQDTEEMSFELRSGVS